MIDPSRARRILAGTAASVFAIAGAAGTVAVLSTAPALAAGHSAGHSAAHGALRPAVSVQVKRVSGGSGARAGAVRAAGPAVVAPVRAPGHKVVVNCFAGRRVADTHQARRFCLRPTRRR